jgi:hypothetical protein
VCTHSRPPQTRGDFAFFGLFGSKTKVTTNPVNNINLETNPVVNIGVDVASLGRDLQSSASSFGEDVRDGLVFTGTNIAIAGAAAIFAFAILRS